MTTEKEGNNQRNIRQPRKRQVSVDSDARYQRRMARKDICCKCRGGRKTYQGNCDLDCCEEISAISGNVNNSKGALGSPSSTSRLKRRDRADNVHLGRRKKPFTRVSSRIIQYLTQCPSSVWNLPLRSYFSLLYSNALYLVVYRGV